MPFSMMADRTRAAVRARLQHLATAIYLLPAFVENKRAR